MRFWVLAATALLVATACQFDGASLFGDGGWINPGAIDAGGGDERDAAAPPDSGAPGVDGAPAIDADVSVDAMVVPVDAAAPTVDAAPPVDAHDDCIGDELPLKPLNIDDCDIPDPMQPMTLVSAGTFRLDTDTGVLLSPGGVPIPLVYAHVAQSSGPDLFVVTFEAFTVGHQARLEVGGAHALLLVSTGDVTVSGQISGAARATATGPGADLTGLCAQGAGTGGGVQVDDHGNTGGSGGGGGAFGGAAGSGGNIDDVQGTPTPPSPGAENGSALLVPLRGGCPGGSGGFGGGEAGAGGGAIEIIAAGTIHVAPGGSISVSGGGGRGAPLAHSGGGGGGSGGGLLLQSSVALIDGALTANGGGGGEGSRTMLGSDSGDDGAEQTAVPADGGSGLSNGGNGGVGGVLASPGGDGESGSSSGSQASGGGGGGGGVGRIRVLAPQTFLGPGAVVSPPML